ncbi:MAG: hypothetical protein HZA24_04740 [Nitrospirae bacterium]|nr:hypothetical protein [Nitrospirota bacterium]
MIAHLVRKKIPARLTKRVACPTCGEKTRTQVHHVVYCMLCGQPIPVPPNPS